MDNFIQTFRKWELQGKKTGCNFAKIRDNTKVEAVIRWSLTEWDAIAVIVAMLTTVRLNLTTKTRKLL